MNGPNGLACIAHKSLETRERWRQRLIKSLLVRHELVES
jgi:hypothetical protein